MRASISSLRTGALEPRGSRSTIAALRHHAAPPLAWLATVLYAAWQLVIEQKLFLHTFLVERIGNPSVPRLPLGYGNVMALKAIMLWRQLRRDPDAMKDVQRRVYRRVHDRLQARGVPAGEVLAITEYQADEIAPRDFYRRHVRKGVPWVLRGFAAATDRWRFADLAERFPGAIASREERSMPAQIENIAPDIFRQRLLIEGFFGRDLDEAVIRDYLLGVAAHLGLRTYGDPVVFSPGSGTGRAENAGFDAFVPLIDSGISGYFWTARQFLSVVLYTCKGFDERAALDYTRSYFEIAGRTVTHAF